jgi:hypothetical protein
MKVYIAIFIGRLAGFISMGVQSLFVSRRDQYHNSGFAIFLWKLSWWIGGFIMGAGFYYRYM